VKPSEREERLRPPHTASAFPASVGEPAEQANRGRGLGLGLLGKAAREQDVGAHEAGIGQRSRTRWPHPFGLAGLFQEPPGRPRLPPFQLERRALQGEGPGLAVPLEEPRRRLETGTRFIPTAQEREQCRSIGQGLGEPLRRRAAKGGDPLRLRSQRGLELSSIGQKTRFRLQGAGDSAQRRAGFVDAPGPFGQCQGVCEVGILPREESQGVVGAGPGERLVGLGHRSARFPAGHGHAAVHPERVRPDDAEAGRDVSGGGAKAEGARSERQRVPETMSRQELVGFHERGVKGAGTTTDHSNLSWPSAGRRFQS